MIITLKQLIALLPLLIIGMTIIFLMLFIMYRRNHFISSTLTIVGLNIALFSLWFVYHNGPMDVTSLVRMDKYSILYIGLLIIASLATSMVSYIWLDNYSDNRDEFYLLLLIATMGSVLLASTNHLASFVLGIELISLPLLGMVGYTFHKKCVLEASIKYALLSASATTFLLFGMALIYVDTGQLSFSGIAKIVNVNMTIKPFFLKPLLLTGFGMMIVGIGFKLSLVPFHLWTPDVYQGSPSSVSIFLATASKVAIFSSVLRFLLCIHIMHNEVVRLVIGIIAFTSILFGNLMALTQNNIKRILGYSSIAHFGYLLIGLISIHPETLVLETVGIYIVGYMLANFGTFSIITLLSNPYTGEDLELIHCYRGLFWNKPLFSFILTVMMLSLAGIPMTLGFIGKFYVISLSLYNQFYWLLAIVIAGSIIGLVYYLRIIISLYLPPSKGIHYNFSLSLNRKMISGKIIVMCSLFFVLLFGLYPQPLITLVQLAQPVR